MLKDVGDLQSKIFYFNQAKSSINSITNLSLALSSINLARSNLPLLQKMLTRIYLIHADQKVNPIFSCEYRDGKEKIEDLLRFIEAVQTPLKEAQQAPANATAGQPETAISLPEFKFEPGLIKVAFEHCIAMAKNGTFTARVSGHGDLKSRCEKYGCKNSKTGQTGVIQVQAAQSIVQLGQLDHSRAVFEMLLDDGADNKKNREYFLNAEFRKLGYGFVYVPKVEVYYVTFIFAGADYETDYTQVEAIYTQMAEGKLMLEVEKMTFEEVEKMVETEKKAEQAANKKN